MELGFFDDIDGKSPTLTAQVGLFAGYERVQSNPAGASFVGIAFAGASFIGSPFVGLHAK